MPGKSKEFSEIITFNAAQGTRSLGAVAAKRAKYDSLSDYLRDAVYALIEKEIPTPAERTAILELLGGVSPAESDDEPAEDTAHNPQLRPLSLEAQQRIRDRIHARGGKSFHDKDKVATG